MTTSKVVSASNKPAFEQFHEHGQDFGDFYPTGNIFAAFPDETSAATARKGLLDSGFAEDDCLAYSADTVRQGSQRGLDQATLLSSIGSTLKMIELHRDLAAKGCHFLLIKAENDEQAERVMRVLRRGPISLAQRYQRLVIETLSQNDPLTGRQK